MNKFKANVKKALAGILSTAMILTSGVIPNTLTNVQAATVYNDTTTALSSLAGSTGLKIYRLTSDDAGKELTSGIYYVDEDLTFTGADSTSSSEAGGNGLKIADGATVYIYIADGKTLTATGGNGYAGADGENGTTGSINIVTDNVKGITFTKGKYSENGAGGAGGSGASGGGAAIYVPNGSKIAILGKGSVNATGGAGGNAGNGQTGQKTLYYNLSWQAPSYNSSVTRSSTTNNIGLATSFSGANTNNGQYTFNSNVVIGGAGGSGGGGAAGGGAGIGTNGANGNVGADGVTGNYDSNNNDYIDKVAGSSATANIAANSSGQIYIGNVTVSATGGIGGQAGSQQAVVDKHKHGITYYIKGSSSANSGNFWVQDGQSGGGGGAGGTGASIGTGGQGGQGGAGGDAGSCWTKDPYSDKSGYAPESVRGANGAGGSNGTGSSSALSDSQYPYNTITFNNLASANQNYYITKSGTFTAPDYSVSENQTFVGWKVTTPAVALPEAFGETASEVLTTADKIIPAGTKVSTAGIYGNITLEPVVVDHAHNWTYEADGNVVKAYCTEANNADKCDYQKGHELTLTLKVEKSKTYSGKSYQGASVEDNISSVTGASAGNITYVGRGETSYTESATAPTEAGKYTAKVTIGGKTATADFTINKADLNLSLALKNWIYGRTPSSPELGNYKGDGTISYFYKKQGEADTEYKSVTEADFNTIVVGKYTLKASVEEGTNYNAATVKCDFSVTKQPITVDVSLDGWTYGDTAKIPSVTVKADDKNITSSYEKSQITYTYYTDSECKNAVTPKNAGTYYVKAEVEATDNYSDGSAVAEFIIAKKAVTATVTADNKTYDGTTNTTVSAAVADSDLVSGDKITIKGITGTFEDQNAGADKKVTVDSSNAEYAGTGVENYDITIGTAAKASINKLTAEFKWSNTDLTYTGSEQSVTAEVSNAVSGDIFTLTYDGNKQTKVGDYTAKVTALGNDNYELPSEENAKTAWKISYLAKGTAEVSGTKGNNDWYVTKVTITPETGYEISTNGTDWKAFLEYDAQGSQTAAYYLRETATGFVSDKKAAEFKIDTELPTGEIKIKDNGFTEFLNTITFKHFFKKTVDVKITGADATSGIAKIEYKKVAKGASFDKDGTWTEGRSFSMTANDKSAIYARITDNAGNYAIINSDGIVVYTDATATAEETFTKISTADITTGITVNGNTIASVMAKNADDESTAATQVDSSNYEIKDDKLVLKASYLQTLAAGTYTFTVSYNPYGEAYIEDSKGDAPDTSVITLTVNKATGSISDISDISKVYDGNAVTAPTFTTTNDRGTDDANVTVEYKKQGAEDDTYTSEAPANSGDYVVRITVKSDEDYDVISATKEFSISRKEMTASADGYAGTYDGQEHGIAVNVTDPADSEVSNIKVVYGTKDTDGKISYSDKPVTYKEAGEYTVYYKVTADNYEDAEGSAVVKISPKTVSLVWSDREFTYDGKAHKPSAKVNDDSIIGTDSVEVTVAGAQTNAGSYTAQAIALSNNNYVLSSDITASFKINKAATTVTVDNAAKHVGKADPKFTYKVTGLAGDDELDGITILRAAGEDAGAYDIMALAKADANPNYDVTCVAGKLTIEDHIKAETPLVENRVEPTCTENGSYDDVYYCSADGCGAELERVHQTIPATGHNYGEAVFTWSDDYGTAEATFTCANDKSHVEKVNAKVTSETVDPTCETDGKTTYTATVEFEGKTYTDPKETVIGAIGHDYADPVFTWSDDHSTVKATFTCKNDKTHVLVKDCEVTAESVDATCTTAGKVTYTASVIVAGKTYTDTKVVNGTALGHKYGTPVFTWSDDYSTAEAAFTCENDKTHVETVNAKVTSETVAATCETAGKTVYTATAEFEGQTYTDSKEVVIKAIGHKYSEPAFTWNEDKATASFTCANDKTHVETVDAKITSKITDATCTAAGKTVYTATVEFGGNTYTDTNTVEIKAKGHTAVKDAAKAPTCTETGLTEGSYCAVCGEILVAQETIPATGHNWSDWKVKKEASATEAGKKESTCTVCGIKRYEVIPATGVPTEDPSNGKLDKDVQVAPAAPVQEATMTNTKAELLEAPKIFTEEEKTQIKEGKVDAKVWMEINETDEKSIPQETKAQVEKEAEKIMGDQASDIMYFDADLFKQVTNPDTGDVITPKQAIHEPGEHIDVTVKIPEKLLIDESKKSMVREYKIIRIHTDQTTGKDIVDVLDGDFNEETGEFSFATDKFSTYAIAFTDVPIEVSISDGGDDSTITAIGDTKQLTAVVTPDSAARRDVKWTSGNLSVATVDENGVVTAVGNGNAVIRVTVADSDVYAEYTVRVNVPAKDTPSKPSNPGSTENPAAPVTKHDTKPATPNKDSKASTKKTAVKTGDENRTWLLIMMMFAGAGMVVFGRKKKENR